MGLNKFQEKKGGISRFLFVIICLSGLFFFNSTSAIAVNIPNECTDNDGDGFNNSNGNCGIIDCDDSNNLTYPGANEICNGIDDNCLNGADEGEKTCWTEYYCDHDFDGYFTATMDGVCNKYGCIESAKETLKLNCQSNPGDDCNDADANNWLNCTNCVDLDNDTYYTECNAYTTINGPDCNDSNFFCDSDCTDNDQDGFCVNHDCNEDNSSINLGANETCNGIDDNCLNGADEETTCWTEYYCDSDNDSFFSLSTTGICNKYKCIEPIQEKLKLNCTTEKGNDCNDESILINSNVNETCDGIDNNCNGVYDENFDLDGDSYTSCGTLTTNGNTVASDCDDANANLNPGANEICGNGIDENCNGVDDACSTQTHSGGGGSACTSTRWICEEWSVCSPEGKQIRNCVNNCGISRDENQDCTYIPQAPVEVKEVEKIIPSPIVMEEYCGNGICSSDEDCTTCESDCGSCPPTGFALFGNVAMNLFTSILNFFNSLF